MASSSAQLALSPQLAELRRQFEANVEHARKMFATCDEARLKKGPPAGGWSPAECVQHLKLTTERYVPLFAEAFTRAKPGGEPYKMDFKGKFLKWMIEPPYRQRIQTRPGFIPENLGSAQQVQADFEASQQELYAYLERANGLALNQTLVESPFRKGFFYNLFSLFHILAAHQRRHLWQAEQALKQTS